MIDFVSALGFLIFDIWLIGNIVFQFIPTRDELNVLKLDKSIDYENLNSKQKRMCLRRLRLRNRYKLISNELEILNKEIDKK